MLISTGCANLVFPWETSHTVFKPKNSCHGPKTIVAKSADLQFIFHHLCMVEPDMHLVKEVIHYLQPWLLLTMFHLPRFSQALSCDYAEKVKNHRRDPAWRQTTCCCLRLVSVTYWLYYQSSRSVAICVREFRRHVVPHARLQVQISWVLLSLNKGTLKSTISYLSLIAQLLLIVKQTSLRPRENPSWLLATCGSVAFV